MSTLMTPTTPFICGLAGTRQTGKSTLCDLLCSLNPTIHPISFAGPLKDDLTPFLTTHYGIHPWTATGIDKELVRPFLILHGMTKRSIDSAYWIRRAMDQIGAARSTGENPSHVLSDVRFTNEATLMRQSYGRSFRLISLTREGAPPPTDEEEKHYRAVAALADRHIHWGHPGEDRQAIARDVLEWLGS